MVLSEKVVVVWVSVVTVKEVVLMGPAEVSVSENVVVSVAVLVVCTVASILEVWGEVLVSVSAAETIDVVSVVTELGTVVSEVVSIADSVVVIVVVSVSEESVLSSVAVEVISLVVK